MSEVINDREEETDAGMVRRVLTVNLDNYEDRAKRVSGAADRDIGNSLFHQVLKVLPLDKGMAVDEGLLAIDTTLSLMENMAPQTAAESMLVSQMIAAHECAMRCYQRGQHGNNAEYTQMMLNQANKLRGHTAMGEDNRES